MRFYRCIPVLIVSIVCGSIPAHAIMVYGDSPNRNRPAEGRGWDTTGSWSGGGGVAIGAHHFLTAHHLGGSTSKSFDLGGTSYEARSVTRINDSDLEVWEIAGRFPEWAPLSNREPVGREATLFGFGPSEHGDVIDENPVGENGWKWTHPGEKSWGTNQIDATTTSNGYDLVRFDLDSDQGDEEGMYGPRDSGGGLFIQEAGQWKLAGIAYAIIPYYKQVEEGGDLRYEPVNGAIYNGNGLYVKADDGTYAPATFPQRGYASDVNAYHDAIVSAIPEPATLALGLLGLPGLTGRRRRFARRR